MNEKFYDLSEEKQSQILNAAYKVFATNQYKKAPTSEIAAEAGISKSLLFHYFHNKLEMYIFLWKHAADLTKKYMCKYQVYETDDFFEMMRRGLMAKCAVMRKYTFLSLFSINSYFETEPDIQSIVQQDVQAALHFIVAGDGVRDFISGIIAVISVLVILAGTYITLSEIKNYK